MTLLAEGLMDGGFVKMEGHLAPQIVVGWPGELGPATVVDRLVM